MQEIEVKEERGQTFFAAEDLLELLDRPIAYHRCFVPVAGSVTAAVFLSQAVYWSKRTSDENGWFWKTQEEWEEETGLTRYEQESARKNLRNAGILEERLAGLPARLFFRIDLAVLSVLLSQLRPSKGTPKEEKGALNKAPGGEFQGNCNEVAQYAVKPHTGMGKSSKLLHYTETTSENTKKRRSKINEIPPRDGIFTSQGDTAERARIRGLIEEEFRRDLSP